MLRSLVYTALTELAPEVRKMTTDDVSRLVTDATERVTTDQAATPALTTWAAMQGYVSDVTAGGTCEPGIWSRYLAAVRATDERNPR